MSHDKGRSFSKKENQHEWGELKNDPASWLKDNLLIPEGTGGTEKNADCYFSGETLPGPGGKLHTKFKLGKTKKGDDAIEVKAHRFAMIDAPPKSAAKQKLAALTLANEDDPMLVFTGQLSGCVVAIGGDKDHTAMTHVHPNKDYKDKAKQLQDDIDDKGYLEPKDFKVKHSFGRNNYDMSQRATTIGKYKGGMWHIYEQKYKHEEVSAPSGRYDVDVFTLDKGVHPA